MFSCRSRNVIISCTGIISAHLLYTRNHTNIIADRSKKHSYLIESKYDSHYTKSIEQAHDFIETERLIQGVPGITIAVMKDNKLIWTQGFGYSDIENRILTTPNSLMRVASISKSFTSAAIGLLFQQNKLNLKDTIQNYITDYPLLPYNIQTSNETIENTSKSNEGGNSDRISQYEKSNEISNELCAITIEQLCNHQSGIRHYKNDEFLSMKEYKTCMDALEIFKNDPLEFKPGTDFKYSTYNYTIVSAIIEQITNMKFVHFMQNEIFNQFKMYNTFCETNSNILRNRSRQYIRRRDENDLMIQKDIKCAVHSRARTRLYNTSYVNNSNKFAGGGFVSTALDIALFGNEIVFGNILVDNIKKQLFLNVRNEYNYGIGWNVIRNEYDEITEISHAGGAVGGVSHLLIVPKDKLVVAILMNLEGGNPYISRQIARYFTV
eukprot:311409_1